MAMTPITGLPLTAAIMLPPRNEYCDVAVFRQLIANTASNTGKIPTLTVVDNKVARHNLTSEDRHSITEALDNGEALPIEAVGLFCQVFKRCVQIDGVMCAHPDCSNGPHIELQRDDMKSSDVVQTYTRDIAFVSIAHLYSHDPRIQSLVEQFTGCPFSNMSQLADFNGAVIRLVRYLRLHSPKQMVLNGANCDVQALGNASVFSAIKSGGLPCVTVGTINKQENTFVCDGQGPDLFVNDRKALEQLIVEDMVWKTDQLHADMAATVRG